MIGKQASVALLLNNSVPFDYSAIEKAKRQIQRSLNFSLYVQQLRYLQTLSNISAEKNSTIIFPLPVEFLAPFFTSNFHPSAIQEAVRTSSEQLCSKQLKVQPDIHSNADNVDVSK